MTSSRLPPSRLPLRRAALLLGAAALLAAVGCGPDKPRHDVLLVSFDTLRADRLGVYGNDAWGVTTSPHADALAQRGVLFENEVATRGQTHPSLASMITGLYPITTGLRENGLILMPQYRTFMQRLHDAGFQTGIFIANFDKDDPDQNWIFRGADVFDDGYAGRFKQEARDESRFQVKWDDRVEAAALKFLDGLDGDRPFAAWVHFYNVHKPYNPPDAWISRYGVSPGVPEVLRAPGPDSGNALEEYLRDITLGNREVPAAELRRILGLYDGGVSATDERLGRLLDKLQALGRLETTFLVFTADHGDELFDHNRYFYHGNSVYQGVLRLPLVIAGPGLPAGARVNATVQNIDVAPTILDLVGLPPVPDLEGRSLVPLLRGQTADPPRPFAFSEWQDLIYIVTDSVHAYVHNPRHANLLKEPYRVKNDDVATRGFAIGCFEGYDLTKDPYEQHDLLSGLDPAKLGTADGLPPEFAPLRRALDAWLAEPRHEREMSWPGQSAEADAKLEAIGYAGGGGRQRKDVLFMQPCSRER